MGADWVPVNDYGQWDQVSFQLAPGGAIGFQKMMVYTGLDQVARVAAPDIDPDHVTVHRIVGNLQWYIEPTGTGDAEVEFKYRITKGIFNRGGTVDVYTTFLNSGADANEQFLTERSWQVLAPEGVPQVLYHPDWAALDLRTKRRLTGSECIAWVGQINNTQPWVNATVEGRIFWKWDLRAWVTTSD